MTIDEVSSSKVVRPESAQQLAEMLSNEKGAVVPLGAGTQTYFGNPLVRADCVVDLKGLARITEYVPADLTIHVEAGVTLQQLHDTLLENNQFLPLDPWNGARATIGGIVAANAQGPFRAVGTIRDWIIGVTVVEIDGRLSKAGGRVVKNVTGYDLQKLYTGSLGTLAVITEISLKLRAKFARTVTAIARFANTSEAAGCSSSLRKGSLQPVSCIWAGAENEVWVRFGEDPRAVDWQLKNLPTGDWTLLEGPDEFTAWERLRTSYNGWTPVVVRVVGMPTEMHAIIAEYQPAAWIGHVMNGIVLMKFPSGEAVTQVRRKYRAIIEKAPLSIRRGIATFGLTDTEYDLMKRMKEAYDPEGRLNPGKHVDGEKRRFD